MKKLVLLSVAGFLCCLAIGCRSGKDHVGTYAYRSDNRNTVSLFADGTFTLVDVEEGRTLHGEYRLGSLNLDLTYDGDTRPAELKEGVLYDPGGDPWDKIK